MEEVNSEIVNRKFHFPLPAFVLDHPVSPLRYSASPALPQWYNGCVTVCFPG
jgi:hypothetical protein